MPGAADSMAFWGQHGTDHVPLENSPMKHTQPVTRPAVTQAQSAGTIISIVGTVLSSVGALLLTISPLVSKLGR